MTKIVFLALAALAFAQNPINTQGSGKTLTINNSIISKEVLIDRVWRQAGPVVVDQVINETLIRQEAQSSRVNVDEKEVQKRLNQMRGPENQKAFEARLASAGLKLEDLKEQINNRLLAEAVVVKAKNIVVAEAEIKAAFKANKDRLGTPDQVRLSQILVASAEEAKGIVARLNKGASFARLANEKSLDNTSKAKGGDLGYFTRGMFFVAEVENAAFALEPKKVSDPVKSPLGFHVLVVTEKMAAKAAVFNKTTKDFLRQNLLQQKIAQALPGYLQELRSKAVIQSNL